MHLAGSMTRERGTPSRPLGALVLAVFVSAGVIKSSPAMAWIPGDLTAIAAVLVMIFMLDAALTMLYWRTRPPVAWIMWAVVLGCLGLFQQSVTDYADAKVPALLTLTLLLSFVGGLLLVRRPRQRDVLALGFVLVSCLVALLAVVAPSTGPVSGGRIALLDSATIAPARALGAGVVVLLVFAFTKRLRLLYALPLALALLSIMIGTGSRGPSLALVAGLLTAIVALRGVRRRRAMLVAVVVGAGGVWVLLGAGVAVRDRFLLLLSDDRGSSISVREFLWSASWDQIQQHPWGVGWGNLAPVVQPLADYPHNFALEVAAEGGLIALAMLLLALVIGIRRSVLVVRSGDHTAVTVLALLIYSVVNAMVSGDLNDNRTMFLLLAASVAARPTAAASHGDGGAGSGARSRVLDSAGSTRLRASLPPS